MSFLHKNVKKYEEMSKEEKLGYIISILEKKIDDTKEFRQFSEVEKALDKENELDPEEEKNKKLFC